MYYTCDTQCMYIPAVLVRGMERALVVCTGLRRLLVPFSPSSEIDVCPVHVYIVCVVLTCANCLTWTTDAPKGLMDSGRAFVAYFEAVKKEYDVCCSPVQLACV